MTDAPRKIHGITLPDRTPPAVGFGRLPSPPRARQKYPMRAALAKPREAEPMPLKKRWRLYRAQQLNQKSTPECVTHCGKHWELSLPTYTTTGLTAHELYVRCKAIDPWPGEDGTSADALLQVYRDLGKVESWHWYDGNQMDALRWLMTKGPLWWGAAWTESMFRTNPSGLIEVSGTRKYGHEVAIIGGDMTLKLAEIVQSWGNENFGLMGRGWISFNDLFDLTDKTGDLVGVVETGTL